MKGNKKGEKERNMVDKKVARKVKERRETFKKKDEIKDLEKSVIKEIQKMVVR